ncbi:LysR family transcriptional regulator [Vannielia litorea]|uniref:Transcriptional regulator, LysR family n=1 Tax=Vannielia litorea TaxID=1217970 RepID=A0A1N6GV25_9RHOB|nr:LysR family transcriptional regulator [Vannielia litorea]SIO11441.1 transcriptional regulator, LysR family [Vannielia litorea]
MIEINHLRCFVVVAEELHFGRAADRLHMTQPPLSRRIQALEQSLGCELFKRNSRSVELTQAGKTLYADAVRILRLLETSVTSVRDVAAGQTGLVRFGFTAASAYHFMPALVSRMGEAMPGVVLKLKEMLSKRQMAALEIGEIEIAMTRLPIDRRVFDFECISREAMRLVCPSSHPLATKSEVTWADLSGLDFIHYPKEDAPHFQDHLHRKFLQHNVTPVVRQELSQIHTIVSLVGKGIGVALVPQSAEVLARETVVFRTISEDDPIFVELYMAWRRDNDNTLVHRVLDIARTI